MAMVMVIEIVQGCKWVVAMEMVMVMVMVIVMVMVMAIEIVQGCR